jgi:hypothetical protein
MVFLCGWLTLKGDARRNVLSSVTTAKRFAEVFLTLFDGDRAYQGLRTIDLAMRNAGVDCLDNRYRACQGGPASLLVFLEPRDWRRPLSCMSVCVPQGR